VIVEAVLIGLAAWRMANFLVNENGPFDIVVSLREQVGVKVGTIEGFFPSLFTCVYCMSVWTAIYMYVLWEIEPIIVMVVAAMAIALVAERFINEQH